jgi:hypothetical protein
LNGQRRTSYIRPAPPDRAKRRYASLKASRRAPDQGGTRSQGPPAMNLSPEQIQEHITKLADATADELDDLLHELFCLAWPTSDGQNN